MPSTKGPKNPVDSAERVRERMRAIRKERGLNDKAWAARAGITRQVLSNFLNGQSETIYFDTVLKLAAAAGVTPDAFVSEHTTGVPRMIAIGWLQLGEQDYSGHSKVGISRSGMPLQFSQEWIDRVLLGEPERGRLFEIVGDPLAPELRSGDIVCIDIERVLPERDPGLYCVASKGVPTVRRVAVLPGDRLRFLSESGRYPEIDVDKADVMIVGRVVWRAGML